MSCKYQECGNEYKVDLIVPKCIWIQITPKSDDIGLLCGSCIMNKIESIGNYDAFHLINA